MCGSRVKPSSLQSPKASVLTNHSTSAYCTRSKEVQEEIATLEIVRKNNYVQKVWDLIVKLVNTMQYLFTLDSMNKIVSNLPAVTHRVRI